MDGSPYTLPWAAAPSKLPLPMRIWTPSNTWFLGPTRVHNPNGVSLGSAVFAGLKIVIDRQTDTQRYFICNSRPHLARTAMRPNNYLSSVFISVLFFCVIHRFVFLLLLKCNQLPFNCCKHINQYE